MTADSARSCQQAMHINLLTYQEPKCVQRMNVVASALGQQSRVTLLQSWWCVCIAFSNSVTLLSLQVLEETGITISDVHFAAAENVVFPTGQHYVVIFMQGHAAAVGALCHEQVTM
jgi:hypothetical protein